MVFKDGPRSGRSEGRSNSAVTRVLGFVLGEGGLWVCNPWQLKMVKHPPAMQETWVGKIPWRRGWQPTPVYLPGESPWTEEPGGLQSMRSQRVGHDWATKHSTTHDEMQRIRSLTVEIKGGEKERPGGLQEPEPIKSLPTDLLFLFDFDRTARQLHWCLSSWNCGIPLCEKVRHILL